MLDFIHACGPFGWPLVALAVLVAVLSVTAALQVWRAESLPSLTIENRITSVLVWGGIAAVLGLLGQCAGIYVALQAISRATEISPPVVWEGFATSFTTTLFGLTVLLMAGVAWLVLRGLYGRALRLARLG